MSRLALRLPIQAVCYPRTGLRAFNTAQLKKEKVTDERIAELASRPLHPITLADLCRLDLYS